MSLRDELREKYLPFRGLETPDQILRLCDEHERAERFLIGLKAILEASPDVSSKPTEGGDNA